MAATWPPFFMPKPINLQLHFAEARKYKTRSEFARGSSGAYSILWRHKLLDQACPHMVISENYSAVRWDPQSAFDEASRYATRAEFKRKASGAHRYLLVLGRLDQACSHMRGDGFWHVFELRAVSIKHSSRIQFKRAEPAAYRFAARCGLLESITFHMPKPRRWSREEVIAEASKHQSRGAFQAFASGAYKKADAEGYLDLVCAHMPPPEYGFMKHKAAKLYQLHLSVPGVGDLFKVGITNRSVDARIKSMGLHAGVNVEVVDLAEFANGRDARIQEKRIHEAMRSCRYTGRTVMKNGNHELFSLRADFPNA